MKTKIDKFRKELKDLIDEGELLRLRMALDLGLASSEMERKLKAMKLPDFKDTYESWYTVSLLVVKQIIPDRVVDFIKQYKDEKRKQTDFLTYGVSDYMIGLQTTRGGEVLVNGTAAYPKFEQQINILQSAEKKLESSLSNMLEVLQADLFDDELEAAEELAKKGFTRGAGAISGVVLEKHLAHVCDRHNCKPGKKNLTINDLNQALKDADVIDTPTWRFIQHLGDIRNLCDHNKGQEPSKENAHDLVSGVSKIAKTVF